MGDSFRFFPHRHAGLMLGFILCMGLMICLESSGDPDVATGVSEVMNEVGIWPFAEARGIRSIKFWKPASFDCVGSRHLSFLWAWDLNATDFFSDSIHAVYFYCGILFVMAKRQYFWIISRGLDGTAT